MSSICRNMFGIYSFFITHMAKNYKPAVYDLLTNFKCD